jgi:hypothetical protein
VGELNGLLYKKLLALYARHFGEENLVIISYEGLKKADLDPWEVLVNEVLGYEGGPYQTPTNSSEGANISLDPFLISLKATYDTWRWAAETMLSTERDNGQDIGTKLDIDAPNEHKKAQNLEALHEQLDVDTRVQLTKCTTSSLLPLADVLPRICSNFEAAA